MLQELQSLVGEQIMQGCQQWQAEQLAKTAPGQTGQHLLGYCMCFCLCAPAKTMTLDPTALRGI